MIDGDALHEEDEGYFASMTDIMVGLLFVFIIVIMFFALQITNSDPDVVSRTVYDKALAERDAARDEVIRLEAETAAKDKTIDRLETETVAKDKAIARLEAETAAKDKAIARLEQEIADLRKKMAIMHFANRLLDRPH